MGARLKAVLRHLPALLGVALLFGAVFVVQREFRHLKLRDIEAALEAIPPRALVLAVIWTLLSYGILTFYDRLGTIYAGQKVSYGKVALASFCAYALSHNLGFAAVSGAAVRYRLYAHWGLTPVQIAKVIAFCSLTFGLGGMVLGGAVLFLEPESVPFFGERLPHAVMYAIGAGMWAIVAGYITLSRVVGTVRLFGHTAQLPGWRMAILQVIVAALDVAATASIFHALLPHADGLTWLRFLGVYLASYTAGLAANLPGGLGVFDTAMLLGLAPWLDPPQIVGAIVVFRLLYYIIPLFIAGALFAGNELLLRGATMMQKPRPAAVLARWNEPDLAVAAGTGAVALCGAALLGLAVIGPAAPVARISPGLADLVAQASQFVPSLIGAGLMVLSIGLSQRVRLAWGATLLLLLIAAALTAVQGAPLWLPGTLVLAALLVAPFRAAFYRDAGLLSGRLHWADVLPLLVLVVCVLTLAVFEPRVRNFAHDSWWALVLSRDVPNGWRATIGATVLLGLLAIWRLVRPARVPWLAWDADARRRYLAAGGRAPEGGTLADGVVWGEAGQAGLAFMRLEGVLLGLGDPAGPEEDRISAVWRFRDLAEQERRSPAIWRAGPDMLRVYADLGLAALPLGADGLPGRAAEAAPVAWLAAAPGRALDELMPHLADIAARCAGPLSS